MAAGRRGGGFPVAIDLLYGSSDGGGSVESFLGEAQRRIYKAIPTHLWINDKSESQVTSETIKMKIEVSLNGVRELLASRQDWIAQ